MNTDRRQTRGGFTLIELLIVVVIIGILASVAVARFTKVKQRSYLATVQTDLRQLAVAQERYHMANFTYTADIEALEFEESSGVTVTVNSATNTGWAASATHVADGDILCGVYVGTAAAADGAPATNPEVVECTF